MMKKQKRQNSHTTQCQLLYTRNLYNHLNTSTPCNVRSIEVSGTSTCKSSLSIFVLSSPRSCGKLNSSGPDLSPSHTIYPTGSFHLVLTAFTPSLPLLSHNSLISTTHLSAISFSTNSGISTLHWASLLSV